MNAEPLNIRLSGPEFEPSGLGWQHAPVAARMAYWMQLGRVALQVKRDEISRGIGRDGKRLKPVKPKSRRDGAKGPPLIPHESTSRTMRLLSVHVMVDGVTLYWRGYSRGSWARILGYHAYKHGARALPVRNTIGVSPAGRKAIAKRARYWWAARQKKAEVVYLEPGAEPKRPSKQIQVYATPDRMMRPKPKSKAPVPTPKPRPTLPKLTLREQAHAHRVARGLLPHFRRDLAEQKLKARAEARRPKLTREAIAARLAQDRPTEALVRLIEEHQGAAQSIDRHGMVAREVMRPVEFEGWTIWASEGKAPASHMLLDQILAIHASPPLPARIKEVTKNIYLSTQRNSFDVQYATQFGIPNFRSGATGGDGDIVAYNGEIMDIGLIAHESGHNLATTVYGGITPPDTSDFGKVAMGNESEVSRYATMDRAEDFAESVRSYVQGHLGAIAPKRYKVIHRIVEDKSYGG